MELKELLQVTANNNASDLHLMVDKVPVVRIDGVLKELTDFPVITRVDMEKMVYNILSERQKEKLLIEKDLDTSLEIEGLARFRISIYWTMGNLALSARVISPRLPTMEEITMPKIGYDFTRLTGGLVLVTGPSGCGKSTTLAAMINLINHERACNIITLEDPIEYVFSPVKSIISQRQLGTDFISFSNALKHIVRQDPDVIMVGEMRDLETIAAAVTLGETGFLVLATLHTRSAARTIDRIIDVFPPNQQAQIRLQLSLSLRGIIAQRLLPKVGGGRIAAREILVNIPSVANLIRENKIAQIQNIIQTSASEGMFTLDQDVNYLYKKGLITKETAKAYLTDSKHLG